jgi:hypothetical protein
VVDKVSAAKSLVDTIRDLATGIMPYWWIAAIGIGVYGIYTYRDVIKARLAEHRSGLNLGL